MANLDALQVTLNTELVQIINRLRDRIAELEADNTLLKAALADASMSPELMMAADEKQELYRLRGHVSQLEADIVTMRTEQEREVNFYVAQLAAVPKWTRITDDPATWPPDRSLIVMADRPRSPYREWRLTVERVNVPEPSFYPSWEYAWLPITPPTEADNA